MIQQQYLALGDSYTIGEQVATADNFPNQAVAILNASLAGKVQLAAPQIIATTGWTTDELAAGIQLANIDKKYDWVSLLIGVNNQYRGRSVEAYATEFEALLQQAIGFANNNNHRVIVLSIPDWGVTPFAAEKDPAAIAAAIDKYNACNRAIAAQYNVHYIDITPLTRTQGTPAYLVEDLLHYNGAAYQEWARHVARVMYNQYINE